MLIQTVISLGISLNTKQIQMCEILVILVQDVRL